MRIGADVSQPSLSSCRVRRSSVQTLRRLCGRRAGTAGVQGVVDISCERCGETSWQPKQAAPVVEAEERKEELGSLQALRLSHRLDGRDPYSIRKLAFDIAPDDSRVILSLGKTKVLAAIAAKLEAPFPDRPQEGFLRFNVEVSAMASPAIEAAPGGGGSSGTKARESLVALQRLVERTLRESGAVDLESLCILSARKVWSLQVDVRVLNHDGNLETACCLTALTALLAFRKPDVTFGPGDGEIVIHDRSVREALPLTIHHLPIPLVFATFQHKKDGGAAAPEGQASDMEQGEEGREEELIALDPTLEEQLSCAGQLVVALNPQGEVCHLMKLGGLPLKASELGRCIRLAATTAQVPSCSPSTGNRRCLQLPGLGDGALPHRKANVLRAKIQAFRVKMAKGVDELLLVALVERYGILAAGKWLDGGETAEPSQEVAAALRKALEEHSVARVQKRIRRRKPESRTEAAGSDTGGKGQTADAVALKAEEVGAENAHKSGADLDTSEVPGGEVLPAAELGRGRMQLPSLELEPPDGTAVTQGDAGLPNPDLDVSDDDDPELQRAAEGQAALQAPRQRPGKSVTGDATGVTERVERLQVSSRPEQRAAPAEEAAGKDGAAGASAGGPRLVPAGLPTKAKKKRKAQIASSAGEGGTVPRGPGERKGQGKRWKQPEEEGNDRFASIASMIVGDEPQAASKKPSLADAVRQPAAGSGKMADKKKGASKPKPWR